MKSYDTTDDWDAGDWADHMGGPDEPAPAINDTEFVPDEPPADRRTEKTIAWMANRDMAEMDVR